MSRSKRNRVPAVIREQLEGLIKERDEAQGKLIKANAEVIEVRNELAHARKYCNDMAEAVVELRKALEDTRRQRNEARNEAEGYRSRCHAAELGMSRAMGWVDAKRDVPPHIESPLEIPF